MWTKKRSVTCDSYEQMESRLVPLQWASALQRFVREQKNVRSQPFRDPANDIKIEYCEDGVWNRVKSIKFGNYCDWSQRNPTFRGKAFRQRKKRTKNTSLSLTRGLCSKRWIFVGVLSSLSFKKKKVNRWIQPTWWQVPSTKWEILLGDPRACSPGKFSSLKSLRCYLLHYGGNFMYNWLACKKPRKVP